MKWVRTMPKNLGAYAFPLSKAYRAGPGWIALGEFDGLEELQLLQTANLALAEAAFGELWVQTEGGPHLVGLRTSRTPFSSDNHHPRFGVGYWMTSIKSGHGIDGTDAGETLLLGPGMLTTARWIRSLSPKAEKSLVHLAQAQSHQSQRGRAAELEGEPFWDAHAAPRDEIVVHTFVAAGHQHRYLQVYRSGHWSIEVLLDGTWQPVAQA